MLIQDKKIYPPYEYQEYPKWVKDKDDKKILVHNKDEEESVVSINEEESEDRSERSRRRKG